MEGSVNSFPLPVLLSYVVVGICVYSGLNHLLITFRNPRERIHGVFGILCFLIALVALSSNHIYQSSTIDQAAFYLKSLVGWGQVGFIFFLWFVGLYTNFLPIKTLVGISAIHTAAIVLNLLSPSSILFTTIYKVTEISLASGGSIWMIDDYDISPGIYLFFITYLVNFSFDAVACYKFYRKGGGLSAHLLVVSLILFIGSVTHDILMSFAFPLTPVTWSEYGFLAVIVLMSLKISSDYYRQSTLAVEDKYRRLVEGLEQDYFVYSKTPEGLYGYISPSAEGIFHVPVQEMIGQNWRHFLSLAEEVHKGEEAERLCRSGKKPSPFEIQVPHRDGSTHVLEIQERPIFDSAGEVILIEGIGKDVTPAKNNERELTQIRDSLRQMNLRLEESIQERTKELSETNERLLEEKLFSESLLESLPGIFYLIQANGRFLRWNKRFEEVTGYSPQEMSEIENVVLFREEDQAELHEVMGRVFQGNAATLECPLVLKDGSTRPYFFTGGRVHLLGQDLIIGMGIDVTEKERAEEASKHAHKLLELHIQNSPLGVIEWNQEFKVEKWSPMASEIFEWTPEEAIGQEWQAINLVHPDDFDKMNTVSDELRSGTVLSNSIVNRNLRKNGEAIWCLWHNSVVHDEQSGVLSILSFVQDITEERRIEIELNNHQERLEQLVQERTAALSKAQEELVRQEKLATLGQVMATISHELRNPLGTIRGSIYIIEQRVNQEDEGLRKPLDRISRNLRRCDQIIDELLDFVRETTLDFSSVQIMSFLEEMVQEYVCPMGIKVTMKLDTDGRMARIDEERFRRCLVNLMNNACDAIKTACESDPDRVSQLTLTASISKGDIIDIRLRDTGSGIPVDLRERIFEPLFSTKNFGIGLGLHIVQDIMKRHGGGIEVEETSSEGTTMRIWLPLIN